MAAEMTTAHCPFCVVLMEPASDTWSCPTHGAFPRCPTCKNPLVGVIDQWCAWCRKWLKLEEK
jgi:hypothetical protein